MNLSIESLLIKSQLAVSKSLHSSLISKALVSAGYDKCLLNRGKDLIDFVKRLRSKNNTDPFHMLDSTNHLFEKHAKLARIVFIEDQHAWTKLNLHPSKNHSSTKWISQAKLFYNGIIQNPVYVEAMKQYGVERTTLENATKNICDIEKALSEDSLFSEQVKERDSAYDKLHNWMMDFESKARIALQRTPDELRKLGIIQFLSVK